MHAIANCQQELAGSRSITCQVEAKQRSHLAFQSEIARLLEVHETMIYLHDGLHETADEEKDALPTEAAISTAAEVRERCLAPLRQCFLASYKCFTLAPSRFAWPWMAFPMLDRIRRAVRASIVWISVDLCRVAGCRHDQLTPRARGAVATSNAIQPIVHSETDRKIGLQWEILAWMRLEFSLNELRHCIASAECGVNLSWMASNEDTKLPNHQPKDMYENCIPTLYIMNASDCNLMGYSKRVQSCRVNGNPWMLPAHVQ